MLQALVNDEVRIRLKWGQTEYTGRLVSVDSYMNVQLSGTEEWMHGVLQGTLGQILIRYVEDTSGRDGVGICELWMGADLCVTGVITCCGFRRRIRIG